MVHATEYILQKTEGKRTKYQVDLQQYLKLLKTSTTSGLIKETTKFTPGAIEIDYLKFPTTVLLCRCEPPHWTIVLNRGTKSDLN